MSRHVSMCPSNNCTSKVSALMARMDAVKSVTVRSCCLFSLRLYFFFDYLARGVLGYGLVVIVPCLQVRPLVSHNEEKT